MKSGLLRILGAVWRSTAALVAFVLVVAAFVLGWALRGGPDPAETTTTVTQPGGDAAPTTYTCSMHPQVRLPDPDAKCPICFMDLIPVTETAGGDEDERLLVMTPAAMKLAEIQVAPVERMYPTRTVRMFGNVDYDETRVATITAYFPGRLERLYVDYTGVRVNEGEHLAEIYSPELNLAHAELMQALGAAGRGGLEAKAATARLAAVREKLRLWGLTEDQIEAMESSAALVDQMTIHAPISGVVIEKQALEGMYVQTGDPVYKVADLSRLWVRLEAYESQLPWLRFGQEIEFTIDSLPGTVFEGQISFIDPVIDPSTRTVRVRLNVDNDDGRLKPGMFVRAAARSRIAGEGLVIDESLRGKWISPMHPEVIKDGPGECDVCGMPLVPIEEYGYLVSADEHGPPLVIYATAPLITGRRAVVFVQVPDAERPTFEMREIVLGPRAGEQYIVASGLEEGEQVVVHGGFKIDSALQLARRPSMMSASGAAATATTVESPTEFLAALGPVFEAYFGAQEALAADDLGAFRSASGALHAAVDEVTVTGLAGEARGRWRRIADGLLTDRAHLDHLDGIEAARALFETYANAAIELDRTFGHAGADAHYVTHCPMAFDFRGASWLARVAEISNPYFGASMLRCGAIKETLAGTHAGDGEDGP